MGTAEVLDIFREAVAVLEGHFISPPACAVPSSSRRPGCSCMPTRRKGCAGRLADKIRAEVPAASTMSWPRRWRADPAYETSRHLAERPSGWSATGHLRLRRFEIEKAARVVIVGTCHHRPVHPRNHRVPRGLGAEVLGCACIIDRSAGKTDVGVPLIALAEYEVPAYPADNLPPELAAIPPVKPGSRNI